MEKKLVSNIFRWLCFAVTITSLCGLFFSKHWSPSFNTDLGRVGYLEEALKACAESAMNTVPYFSPLETDKTTYLYRHPTNDTFYPSVVRKQDDSMNEILCHIKVSPLEWPGPANDAAVVLFCFFLLIRFGPSRLTSGKLRAILAYFFGFAFLVNMTILITGISSPLSLGSADIYKDILVYAIFYLLLTLISLIGTRSIINFIVFILLLPIPLIFLSSVSPLFLMLFAIYAIDDTLIQWKYSPGVFGL
jgi:hypothetical protein